MSFLLVNADEFHATWALVMICDFIIAPVDSLNSAVND
jgi:hypothetical protein